MSPCQHSEVVHKEGTRHPDPDPEIELFPHHAEYLTPQWFGKGSTGVYKGFRIQGALIPCVIEMFEYAEDLALAVPRVSLFGDEAALDKVPNTWPNAIVHG